MEEALRRGWENLFGRLDGPMSFRLIIQPAVAIFFAIRAGLRDARNGQPPFLWAVFSNPGHRHELLRQGWKDVGTVFIVAHSMAQIEETCNRVIWLEKGQIVRAGDDVPGIIDAYLAATGGEPLVREGAKNPLTP